MFAAAGLHLDLAAIGFLLGVAATGIAWRFTCPVGWILAPVPMLALAATATVYLSVPDTEASVLLGAALVPLTATSALLRWRGSPAAIAVWSVGLAGAVAAVVARAAGGPWTWAGWWIPKVGLAVFAGVALGWAVTDRRRR